MNSLRKLLLLCLLCFLPQLCCAEDKPGLQLETVPLALELTSCEEGSRLLVIARNSSAAERALDLQIKTFADVPVAVKPESIFSKELKPGQSISWELTVTCSATFTTGALQVVLSGNLDHAGGPLAQITAKPVALKLRDPQLLDSIAAIEVKSTLESLNSGEDALLNVAITNKTARPIKVSSIKPGGLKPVAQEKPDLKFTPEEATGLTIDAFHTEIVPFTVSAQGRVKPGKQLLIFSVQLQTDRGPRDYLVTREVTIGVLGASAVLQLLGVPSLLLLPGFLFMSSWLLLWRQKFLRHDSNTTPPLDEKSSGFWLLSITLSIVISGVFWYFRRDFFSYYSLADLITVWLVSIGLGCAAYSGWHHYLNRREEAKYPRKGDEPAIVLAKLQPFTDNTLLPRVNFKGGKAPAFLLIENADGPAIICPQMVLTWNKHADNALQGRVQDGLEKTGSIKKVLAVLQEDARKKEQNQQPSVSSFIWDTGTDPANVSVRKIAKEELLDRQPADFIIRIIRVEK